MSGPSLPAGAQQQKNDDPKLTKTDVTGDSLDAKVGKLYLTTCDVTLALHLTFAVTT